MKDLSVVVPFVGEFPQVLFTIQATAQSLLHSGIDFEIIAVNNYCQQVIDQAHNSIARSYQKNVAEKKDLLVEDICEFHRSIMQTYEDKSGPSVQACAKGLPWLKYLEYKDRLSHWQAKRIGVENSEGRILFFMDAHCVPSFAAIESMYKHYAQGYPGTFHLPLTYKILEYHKLIYKPKIENKYFYSYSFSGFRESEDIYEVPCMSTCGMMISREIYEALGGWPKGLGIYGGGENFMNYTLAVCGYKKWIYPHGVLFHHGEKRDYHYLYDNFIKNRMIAHYLFGGKKLLLNYISICKGKKEVLEKLASEAIDEHQDHREKIKKIQKYEIEEWIKPWIGGE